MFEPPYYGPADVWKSGTSSPKEGECSSIQRGKATPGGVSGDRAGGEPSESSPVKSGARAGHDYSGRVEGPTTFSYSPRRLNPPVVKATSVVNQVICSVTYVGRRRWKENQRGTERCFCVLSGSN